MGPTLKQLSSIFLFYAATLFVPLNVGTNACFVLSATANTLPSPFSPGKLISRFLSDAIKIDDIDIINNPHQRTSTIGTVGGILNSLENVIPVDSTKLGSAAGYLLAGTFLTTTLLYNWENIQASSILSGLTQTIVPKFIETEKVDEDNRRSYDYADSSLVPRYCKKCLRKFCPKYYSSKYIRRSSISQKLLAVLLYYHTSKHPISLNIQSC